MKYQSFPVLMFVQYALVLMSGAPVRADDVVSPLPRIWVQHKDREWTEIPKSEFVSDNQAFAAEFVRKRGVLEDLYTSKAMGKVLFRMEMDCSGKVLNVSVRQSTITKKNLEARLVRKIARWKLPPVESGTGRVRIDYLFNFSFAGEDGKRRLVWRNVGTIIGGVILVNTFLWWILSTPQD